MTTPVKARASRALLPWPGLLAGMLLLALARCWQSPAPWADAAPMLLADALMGLRLLAVAMLLSWLLSRSSRRTQGLIWGVGGTLVWTVLVGLETYHELAGVPLGSDVLAYSGAEIVQTVSAAGLSVSAVWWAAWLASAGVWWLLLLKSPSIMALSLPTLRWGLAVVAMACWVLPWQFTHAAEGVEHRTGNKLAYLLAELVRHAGQASTVAEAEQPYPFEHPESTPDTLGPMLGLDPQKPPHVVLVIVEGLGRSFSGPDARLGSFTPFLDELAQGSLYWENFLAPQGRTFGVLPSVLSSLPFADHGEHPKPHHNLPSWLKRNGYALRYFTGTDLTFDHQGDFLRSVGFESLHSDKDLVGVGTRIGEWGYPDGDLLSMVLSQPWPTQPSLTLVQTMSMHSPFQVPRMDEYRALARARMGTLGLSAEQKAQAERHLDVYASILYTDEQLRLFYQRWQKMAQARNALLVITGDHRLPEIAMQAHLERFHVPLIIQGPLHTEPRRIKSVSTHFDIAPSLQALLARQYGWTTPQIVHWMGSGLDVHPQFRNLHAIPLKQTKTELVDFVSGEYVLHRDRLLSLRDGILTEPEDMPDIRTQLRQALGGFQARLQRAVGQASWVESAPDVPWVAFDATGRSLQQGQKLARYQGVSVTDVQTEWRSQGTWRVRSRYTHSADRPSAGFVPLLVITNARGQEVAERSGKFLRLKAGESVEVELELSVPEQAGGELFASMVVSHPDTGKSIGRGQYHVALRP
ncbi:MAG: LTA synthase family protein [Betaproteobacteria bacterium]